MTQAQAVRKPESNLGALLLLFAVGALVAVLLGVYGKVHTPAGYSINIAGFSSTAYVKAWLATIAFVLALVQIFSALVIFGRIKLANPPTWIPGLHRWSGRIAVLVTVPVAVHCLYQFGFKAGDTRVLVHSLLGCLFYGAFVTKMLVLSRKGLPSWGLPVIGGVVFTALVGLWLTAGLYVFTKTGFHF